MELKEAIRTLLECGVKLEAKSETVASAAIYLHRFFREMKADEFDPLLICATCLYLAGKVEEDHLRVRDIINVFYAAVNPGCEPLDLTESYWSLRDSIVQSELLVLRVLKFQVTNQHPHRYLLHYIRSLSEWMQCQEQVKAAFARTCWSLLNDYYTDWRYVTHRPSHIAVAIIQLVLIVLKIEVPYNEEALLGWNEAFCEDASKETIWNIILQIMSVYEPMMEPLKRTSSSSPHPSSTPSPVRSQANSQPSPKSYVPNKIIQYPKYS